VAYNNEAVLYLETGSHFVLHLLSFPLVVIHVIHI